MLHLEKTWKHLLYVWAYLLKNSMILNEKILKSMQEFQKLGNWLTEIEKNALQETLTKYKKNLELQKEFMKSWSNRQKCMQKIYTKPQIQQKSNIVQPKEIIKPKKEVSSLKQNSNNIKKETVQSKQKVEQIKQKEPKKKQKPIKTAQKPVKQKSIKSEQSDSQTKKETNNNQQKQSGNTKPVKKSNWF